MTKLKISVCDHDQIVFFPFQPRCAFVDEGQMLGLNPHLLDAGPECYLKTSWGLMLSFPFSSLLVREPLSADFAPQSQIPFCQ